MTPEEFEAAIHRLLERKDKEWNFDAENLHGEIDKLMCKILTDLGYGVGIEIFESIETWCT